MELPCVDLRRRLLCLPQPGQGSVYGLNGVESRAAGQLTALFAARLVQQSPQSDTEVQGAIRALVEFGVGAGVDAFSAFSDGWIGWFDSTRQRYVEGRVAGASTATLSQLMDAIAAIVGDPRLAQYDAPPLAGGRRMHH